MNCIYIPTLNFYDVGVIIINLSNKNTLLKKQFYVSKFYNIDLIFLNNILIALIPK